jgi:hypothetical protein
MKKRLLRLFLVLPLLIPVLPARASTVAPPAHLGHLARISDAVVFAQAIDSRVEEGERLPYTVTRFSLLRAVAGAETGFIFEVREPGGSGQHRAAAVAGAPRFAAGQNYLLFLQHAPEGRWQARMMSYGLLTETEGDLLAPLPEADHLEVVANKSYEPVGAYHKEALLGHLRDVARGAAAWNARQAGAAPLTTAKAASSAVAGAAYTAPTNCVFLTDDNDGLPIRWFGYETGATSSMVSATTPGQNGISDGGVGAVQAGAAAWTNHPDSAILLNFAGTRARNLTCTDNFDYDSNAVVFNDPCGDIPDLSSCVGTLAFGGAIYDPSKSQPYDGQPWHSAFSTFVVVNNGTECIGEVSFQEAVSHELGHTQGFGHHTPPNPADALMSAKLKADGLGPALRSLDKVCAEFAYHTFLDVPYSHPFWHYIQAIADAGITTGCATGTYCPGNPVSRSEMAVFLVRGLHGSSYTPPPATGRVFSDVPASQWAAAYIEQIYRDGLTNGCGTGVYCPYNQVSRSEMAVFLERVKRGSGYTPPPASGTVFADVPASYWAASWIEQLYSDGVTNGCGGNPPDYCPADQVTRDQMAAFLARIYNLPLP